jgi:glyoxylase-like metal-dependent hydrolase (beta-lactamase superfamily II)
MKELAPKVWHVQGFAIPNAINAYLVGDVLIDASSRGARKRILKQLQGHEVNAHALTHSHADHQGSSHAICEQLGIPFWVPERDADAAEDPDLIRERQPDNPISQTFIRMFIGPGHPVDRKLREGDEVAGFAVIDVPGHSLGHVAFWRESDRVLIVGDVLANMNTVTGMPGLNLAHPLLTPDSDENRRSAKKLGPLEPALVCFGHGKPLRDTRKFVEFCEKLPAD